MTGTRLHSKQGGQRQPHPFADDGTPDHTGATRCRVCALGQWHRVHVLPGVDPAVAEVEARRMGEG